jgi:hypothetical protein
MHMSLNNRRHLFPRLAHSAPPSTLPARHYTAVRLACYISLPLAPFANPYPSTLAP